MSAPRQAGDWWKAARQQIDTLDARLLLHTVTGISHAALLSHPETLLTPAEQERLAHLTQRRAAGEPLAYLTNEAGFYGRNFAVAAGQVLIPRPETEELVDRALTLLAQLAAAQTPNILKALDLGTGSGVIPVSLALEYRGSIPLAMTAAEISPAALA
ncbi:MAG: peptide chain release factor N(5)-glutamine methyltransferase, partial [Zoogloeaceae bacterium]|nr:peptide chain release factor N(5)-glutamine methyltransferase [Zoogloeaceae bacterium]